MTTVSELQKAANRVREIQAAITEFEGIKKHLTKEVDSLELQYAAACRNLADTKSLLKAQYEKRERELEEMRRLSYQATRTD